MSHNYCGRRALKYTGRPYAWLKPPGCYRPRALLSLKSHISSSLIFKVLSKYLCALFSFSSTLEGTLPAKWWSDNTKLQIKLYLYSPKSQFTYDLTGFWQTLQMWRPLPLKVPGWGRKLYRKIRNPRKNHIRGIPFSRTDRWAKYFTCTDNTTWQ